LDPISLFIMAIESITAHKLRSFLVTLGVLIGIAAVLINAAMVEGVQAFFEKQMQQLGSNFITIRPGSSMGLFGPQLEEEELLDEYLFDSVRRLPYVDDATASRTEYGTIEYMGEEAQVLIIGAEPGYLEARNREMILGSPLSPQDGLIAVVGDTVMKSSSLRPTSLMSRFKLTINSDGNMITEEFRVKGIVDAPDTLGMGTLYLPVRVLNSMLGTKGYNEITLFASDINNIDKVEQETRMMLDQLLRVEPNRNLETRKGEEGFLGISSTRYEEKKEYRITTQADLLGVSEDITGMIQIALVAIAGISLLVGGIGIANVMLVTVSERTREIGVMKAVGAKNRQILISFLFEAGFIGILGGIIGLAIATAAALTLVPLLFKVPGALPVQWAIIAIGISLLISILSGLYPALRASRMDPVEALRTE